MDVDGPGRFRAISSPGSAAPRHSRRPLERSRRTRGTAKEGAIRRRFFGRLPRRTTRGARARLEKLRRPARRCPPAFGGTRRQQPLAPGAAARRRRAWCPTAQEPSTIDHYHGCHRRRLRSSSPRPRSDLVPRLSSLQQRRGPRQGVQRRRAGRRGAASYRAVAPAHRAGPLHPEAACGGLPASPCDPMG